MKSRLPITAIVLAIMGLLFLYLSLKTAIAPTNAPVNNAPVNTPVRLALPAGEGPCMINVQAEAQILTRADAGAEVFGSVQAGEKYLAGGWTADGWIGFDPAVAQATNVGPFRLRWFAPAAPTTLTGNCVDLKFYPNLPPRTCFAMAQTDVIIYEQPVESSKVVATIHFDDYIEVTGNNGSRSGWFKVQSPVGSLPDDVSGWITDDEVSFNGRDCDNLL